MKFSNLAHFDIAFEISIVESYLKRALHLFLNASNIKTFMS